MGNKVTKNVSSHLRSFPQGFPCYHLSQIKSAGASLALKRRKTWKRRRANARSQVTSIEAESGPDLGMGSDIQLRSRCFVGGDQRAASTDLSVSQWIWKNTDNFSRLACNIIMTPECGFALPSVFWHRTSGAPHQRTSTSIAGFSSCWTVNSSIQQHREVPNYSTVPRALFTMKLGTLPGKTCNS